MTLSETPLADAISCLDGIVADCARLVWVEEMPIDMVADELDLPVVVIEAALIDARQDMSVVKASHYGKGLKQAPNKYALPGFSEDIRWVTSPGRKHLGALKEMAGIAADAGTPQICPLWYMRTHLSASWRYITMVPSAAIEDLKFKIMLYGWEVDAKRIAMLEAALLEADYMMPPRYLSGESRPMSEYLENRRCRNGLAYDRYQNNTLVAGALVGGES